jgi:hypothetical protein
MIVYHFKTLVNDRLLVKYGHDAIQTSHFSDERHCSNYDSFVAFTIQHCQENNRWKLVGCDNRQF